MIHTLKTDPAMWSALVDGSKTAEIRRDDRAFAVGDVLVLRCYDRSKPPSAWDAGPFLAFTVTHVLRDAKEYGIDDGFAMLSLRRLGKGEGTFGP